MARELITLCIVGVEFAKLTRRGELRARLAIHDLFDEYVPDRVISGECHLGGIDIFAREEAELAGIPFKPFPPKTLNWDGYTARNLAMAHASDICICLTVTHYHDKYKKDRYTRCYHCNTDSHVKSGGCYTVKHAIRLGHRGETRVIEP